MNSTILVYKILKYKNSKFQFSRMSQKHSLPKMFGNLSKGFYYQNLRKPINMLNSIVRNINALKEILLKSLFRIRLNNFLWKN